MASRVDEEDHLAAEWELDARGCCLRAALGA
jgi:hypothetical protein